MASVDRNDRVGESSFCTGQYILREEVVVGDELDCAEKSGEEVITGEADIEAVIAFGDGEADSYTTALRLMLSMDLDEDRLPHVLLVYATELSCLRW